MFKQHLEQPAQQKYGSSGLPSRLPVCAQAPPPPACKDVLFERWQHDYGHDTHACFVLMVASLIGRMSWWGESPAHPSFRAFGASLWELVLPTPCMHAPQVAQLLQL